MVAELKCEPAAGTEPPRIHHEAHRDPPPPRGGFFSVGTLLRELLEQITMLFRQELRLARAEMMEKGRKVGINAISIGIGVGFAFAGALALIAAACTGLWAGLIAAGMDHGIAVWLAPLIIGGVLALVGWALIQKGVSTLKDMSVTPDKTTDSLKETARWMQHKVS